MEFGASRSYKRVSISFVDADNSARGMYLWSSDKYASGSFAAPVKATQTVRKILKTINVKKQPGIDKEFIGSTNPNFSHSKSHQCTLCPPQP